MRSKSLSLILVALVTAALVAPTTAGAQRSRIRAPRGPRSESRQVRFVPGQALVRFAPGVDGSTRTVIHRAAGARVLRRLLLPDTYLVEVRTGVGLRAALDRYRSFGLVRHATRNALRYKLSHTTPNDPSFSSLWGLNNTGQTVQGVAGTPDKDIDALEAWHNASSVGSAAVRVAVIDDGVNWNHPDLAGNIFNNAADPIGGGDNDGNGLIDDFRGWDFSSMTGSSIGDNNPIGADTHGTHVAGTIGAVGNNNTGITGVMQDVSLLPIRIFNDAGVVPADATINAFVYAGMMGAKVANGSFGGPAPSAIEVDAIEFSKNTLFVFAAGNDGSNNDQTGVYPCNYAAEVVVDNIICVAATDPDDQLAEFSNRGAGTVHISAPGTSILSTSRHRFIHEEDFEGIGGGNLPGGWTDGGTANDWGTFPLTDGSIAFGSNVQLSYPNNSNSFADMPGLDLSGSQSCALDAFIVWEFAAGDVMTLEASENAGPFQVVKTFAGTGPATAEEEFAAIDLTNFMSSSTVLRWHLVTNASGVAGGSIIDDLAVRCNSVTGSDGEYQFLQGTSMAAPHVAGAAAFLYSLPANAAANPFSMRRALMASGDLVPAGQQGLTVSGRRLNLDAGRLQDAVPPPIPTLGGPTLGKTFQKKPSIALNTSAGGAAGYWIRLDRTRHNRGGSTRSFASSGGSKTVSLPAGSTYCISANSIEAGTGNESNFGAERCTAVPVNNTAMKHSTGWTKKKTPGTFMSTFSQTSKKGATLALTGVIFDKLSLVATKCRGCGTVGLFLGKSKTPFKRVSLNATRTKKLQIISLFGRPGGPFISKVTIKVLSSSKPVKIEGLGVFRKLT